MRVYATALDLVVKEVGLARFKSRKSIETPRSQTVPKASTELPATPLRHAFFLSSGPTPTHEPTFIGDMTALTQLFLGGNGFTDGRFREPFPVFGFRCLPHRVPCLDCSGD